jgi:hypothetical protein
MKNSLIFISLFTISLSLISCEENFSPKTGFRDEYVLNSIISGSAGGTKSSIYISVSKLYNVDGLNPYLNKTDPVVLGAAVTIRQNNRTYECLQDTLQRSDTSRYNTPYIYYASPPLEVNYYDQFWITANLPNGEKLSGYTRIPRPFIPAYSFDFTGGITTRINRFLWGNSWEISWDIFANDLFFPKLVIVYQKKLESTIYISDSTGQVIDSINYTTKEKEIPMKYINQDGSLKPVYPTYTTGNSIIYDFDAIDSAMVQISAGDPNKKNYRIISIIFQMTEFDHELSNYYSSTHGYLDNYSLRLDETIYSNVNGGIGIIGSKVFTSISFTVRRSYISLFGYRY